MRRAKARGERSGPPVILISHAYSRANNGDAALLACLVAEVRRLEPDADVKVLTLEKLHGGEQVDGAPLLPSLMQTILGRGGTNRKLARGTAVIAASLVWAMMWRLFRIRPRFREPLTAALTAYSECDAVIAVGGGYLRAFPGARSTFSLLLLLHPFVLAAILGKPTVLFSQSIGPFYGAAQHVLVRVVLNRCTRLILAREDKTVHLLNSIGVRALVRRSVDTGFLVSVPDPPDGVGGNNLELGITVRDWLPPLQQREYEKAVAALADHAIRVHGLTVVFIPQVAVTEHSDDDRLSARRVAGYMTDQSSSFTVIEEPWQLTDIVDRYAQLSFLVGTRFHSVIFALCAGVPVLAIEYEHKTSGILQDLGLDEWWLDIHSILASELVAKFDKLVNDRMAVSERIARTVPPYRERAREAIEDAFASLRIGR